MFSVHIFACVFFRVKIASALVPEDVTAFYTSKNVASNVSRTQYLQNVNNYESYLPCIACCTTGPWTAICELLFNASSCPHLFFLLIICVYFVLSQLVCFYYVLTTFTTVGYGESCAPSIMMPAWFNYVYPAIAESAPCYPEFYSLKYKLTVNVFCRRYICKFWRRTGNVCDVQCWSMTTQKWK